MPFYGDAKTVLHLIPINSFDSAQSCDIDKICSNIDKIDPLRPGRFLRYDLDGILSCLIYNDTRVIGTVREGKTNSFV